MSSSTIPRSPLGLDQLSDLTDRIARSGSWRRLVRFDPAGRWWTRLPTDAHADVWLLTWLTGHATDLHDHGESAAAFTVADGQLDEIRADSVGRLARRTARSKSTLTVLPGTVHDVRNPFTEPAVSIHAYSPPLRVMNFYRPDIAGLRRVGRAYTTDPEAMVPEAESP